MGEVLEPDQLIWSGNSSNKFFVQSMYNLLQPFVFSDSSVGSIRKSKLPSKSCFLLWLVFSDKVLAHDNMKKRGIQMTSQCSLCQKGTKSVDHLFLHCEVAFKIWGEFFLRFSQLWALPGCLPLLLSLWYGSRLRHLSLRRLILWRASPTLCVGVFGWNITITSLKAKK